VFAAGVEPSDPAGFLDAAAYAESPVDLFSDAPELDFEYSIRSHEAEPARTVEPLPPRVAPSAVPATPAFAEPKAVVRASNLKVAPGLSALQSEGSLSRETYRALASELLHLGVQRKLKTILVTSAQQGEGKTTIGVNLAWSLAQRFARRVLLIDVNAGGIPMSRMLGLSAHRGWLDLAQGRCEFQDAALRIDPNGLYVLAQGSANKRDFAPADQQFNSKEFEKLLTTLERDFDFIIIDSQAILDSWVAQRLASVNDGVVFVVRGGHTHHSAVTRGLTLVPPDRRLGVVLNDSEVEIEYQSNTNQRGRLLRARS
jgi:Mrp family chromosome partitioning ATPase